MWSDSGREKLDLTAIGAPNYNVLNNMEVCFNFTGSLELKKGVARAALLPEVIRASAFHSLPALYP